MELTQRGHFLLDYDGKAVKYVPAYLPFLTCDAYVPVLCTYIITKQLNTCGCVETLQVRGSNQHSGKPQFCFVYIVRIYAIKTHFTSLMTPGVHRVSAPVKFDSARHHKLDFCSPPPLPSLPVVQVVKLVVCWSTLQTLCRGARKHLLPTRRWRKCSHENVQLQWLALTLGGGWIALRLCTGYCDNLVGKRCFAVFLFFLPFFFVSRRGVTKKQSV